MPVSDETFGGAAGHPPQPSPDAIASRHRLPPSGQPEPARAAPPPGVGKDSPEGRARAVPQVRGFWWCMYVIVQMKPFERDMHLGGADSARPGTRRMVSPPDRRRPRMHVEVGLLTRPSSGPSTRVAPAAAWTGRGRCFGRVFRHGPWREKMRHVRHRPAPVIHPARQAGKRPRPGGWLCTTLPKERRPPAEPRWPSPPPARNADVCAPDQGAFPPAWLETFAIHPAAGADRVWHGDGGCG
jgi:hypothetical protein